MHLTTGKVLKGFAMARTDQHAMIYTDEAAGYKGLPHHAAVAHGVGRYVRGQVHTNGIESFWAMLKRGHYGTYHKMSPKHLERYVQEFAGRNNERDMDTPEQMESMVVAMEKKRLRYTDLIRDNGLPPGARAWEPR